MRAKRLTSQCGAYFVIMTIGIVVLLLLGGLIIDSAKLYRARIRMQKAVDTGVLAGLTYRIENGPIFQTKTTYTAATIENRAREIVLANLTKVEFKSGIPSPVVSFDAENVRLRAQVGGNIDLFIMDVVPMHMLGMSDGYKDGVFLEAISEGEVAPANVALLLDVSGSMGCPSSGDDAASCLCMRSFVGCVEGADDPPSKLTQLKTAATNFVGRFTPNRDKIGIVAFNTGAALLRGIGTFGSGTASQYAVPSDWAELNGKISVLTAKGNTNPSAALTSAYIAMRDAGVIGQEEAWYVLFTDGAPTAARFLFTDPQNDQLSNLENQLNDAGNTTMGIYDYLHYKLDWRYPDMASYFTGPSPLIKFSTPGLGQDVLFNHVTAEPPSLAVLPTCTIQKIAVHDETDPGSAAEAAFGGCLDKFNYNMPGDFNQQSEEWVRAVQCPKLVGLDEPDNVSDSVPGWLKHYYNVTLSLGDHVRTHRGTVLAIGLGAKAGVSAGSDPYQDADDDTSRKDAFLARLALDPQVRVDAQPVKVDFPCLRSWSEAVGDSKIGRRTGQYLPTDNAAELDALFQRFARRILLRLIRPVPIAADEG